MNLLLIEPNKNDATSYYRSRGVIPYLCRENNINLIPCSDWQNFGWTEAVLGDVAFIQRPCMKPFAKIMAMLKDCGVRIVVDYDDDLLNIENHNPVYTHHRENRKHLVDCLGMADTVIVSTDALKQVYAPYNKNIVVIPNAHNDYLFPAKKKNPFAITDTVYYRGGSTHQMDVYKHHADVVSIIKQFPERKFYFIGDRFFCIESQVGDCDNYFVSGYQSTFTFFQSLYSLHPMIQLNLLENTVFNQSKSNCGWLEATYAGAASFAPAGLAEFEKVPCIKFGNLKTAFAAADLDQIKSSHDWSWEYIQDNLLLSRVNKLREDVILG